jgi:endonuclease/exonuclease/phosphatase family metal-dependent hydrolase
LERENGQEWDCFKQFGRSDIAAKGAIGRSSGLAFWWRKSSISVTEIIRDRFLISCRCQSPQGDMEWFISCIYGPCVATDRVGLWEELYAMHQRVQETPWLLGGDFNCYLSGDDNPDGRVDSSTAGFHLAVQNMGLTEYPISGMEYTWRNGSGKLSKLDRFFGSPSLLERFQLSAVLSLDRPFSDHTPLVWDSGVNADTGSYFKLKRSWFREEGFVQMVSQWWQSKDV